jgi:hypothetical protein
MINWLAANRRYLQALLDRPRQALYRLAAARGLTVNPAAPAVLPAAPEPPAAITMLSSRLALSRFEADLLLLLAGCEMEADIAAMAAELQGGARSSVSFALALAALDEPHWDALSPAAPLRRWRLIEIGPGDTLTGSPLRLDERVLHYLAGIDELDQRLFGLMLPLTLPLDLPASQQSVADHIVQTWQATPLNEVLPLIQIDGSSESDRRNVAAAACAAIGRRLFRLPVAALSSEPGLLEQQMRLIEREAALSGLALLIEEAAENPDAPRGSILGLLVERIDAPLVMIEAPRRPLSSRIVVRVELRRPSALEQRLSWQLALTDLQLSDHQLDQLTAQFTLSSSQIAGVVAEARSIAHDSFTALWDGCRRSARPRLDDLAQRLPGGGSWHDLVLPDAQLIVLQEMVAAVRQRTRVYDTWGMGGRSGRGLGISAMFAGVSGTGKTTAAEVIAAALQLDLYRIDLSAVVSKYIGETEKNLRRVFDAAEEGGAILLFDEADALFGKRSDVKDSHDRYANIEVGYLLQRMEAYRGLAILTTNLRNALDTAFLRRIRFVVDFPFPDWDQRTELWRRAFPPGVPTDDLRPERLAQLSIAGGSIRNIALGAAFLAADDDAAVTMEHVLRAARSEYAKLERSLTDAEINGWIDDEPSSAG